MTRDDWSAISAVSQALLAAAALIFSLRQYRESLQGSDYGEIDRMYFDLLALRLENPNLRCSEVERTTTDAKEEYDVYAYMVWNFIESIHDRCERGGRADRLLCATWYPVIEVEHGLHNEWLSRPENHGKFKQSLHDFIADEGHLDEEVRKVPSRPIRRIGARARRAPVST